MARTESNESILMRKKARQRLIGAIVLVMLAVALLPMVLDRQPQPLSSKVVISMPQSTPSDPTSAPASATNSESRPIDLGYEIQAKSDTNAPASQTAVAAPSDQQNNQSSSATQSPVLSSLSEPPVKSTPAAITKPKEAEQTVSEPAAPVVEKPEKVEKPTKPTPKAVAPAHVPEKQNEPVLPTRDTSSKFIIQLGTFSNPDNASKLVEKVNAIGLNAYTETLQNHGTTTIRVRVGPFSNKEAASSAKSQLEANTIHEGRILQR